MTALPEPMDVALRAWAIPEKRRKTGSGKKRRHRPEALVVFDTETELGGSQDLIVGAYRYVRVEWKGSRPTLRCAEEGLFHPDDLTERDPEQLSTIRDYAARASRRRRPEPTGRQPDAPGAHPPRVLRADAVGGVLAQPGHARRLQPGLRPLPAPALVARRTWALQRGVRAASLGVGRKGPPLPAQRHRPSARQQADAPCLERGERRSRRRRRAHVERRPLPRPPHAALRADEPGPFARVRERSASASATRSATWRSACSPRSCSTTCERTSPPPPSLPARRCESSTATPCRSRRTGPTPLRRSAPPTSGASASDPRWSEPRSPTPSSRSPWAPSTGRGSRCGSATSRSR